MAAAAAGSISSFGTSSTSSNPCRATHSVAVPTRCAVLFERLLCSQRAARRVNSLALPREERSVELSIGLISICQHARRSRRLRPFPLCFRCSKPGGCSATVLAKTPSATELDGRFSCYARHGSTTRGDDQTNVQSVEGAAHGPHLTSPGKPFTNVTWLVSRHRAAPARCTCGTPPTVRTAEPRSGWEVSRDHDAGGSTLRSPSVGNCSDRSVKVSERTRMHFGPTSVGRQTLSV